MHTSRVYGIFPRSLVSKESAYEAQDLGSIPGSGRSVVEGNGNPLQHSCLENAMDRGAWQAANNRVRHDLSDLAHTDPFRVKAMCLFSR